MVILHIAYIDPFLFGGVSAAVPKMVISQERYAEVALVNIQGSTVSGIKRQLVFTDNGVCDLPTPFDRPDMVVFHEVYRPEYLKIYRSLVAESIPFVIVPHGCLTKQAQRRKFVKKAVANILLFNRFIRSSLSLQYLSKGEMERSAFKSIFGFICGFGVDPSKKIKTEFSANGIKMVYIGRLEIKTKGLDLLLDAVFECRDLFREKNTRIAVYGPDNGGERKKLERIVERKGIGDIVSFNGPVIGEEKERILLDSDYFVQTSRTEGLPMGLLEALSFGIPCIVTSGTGFSEFVSMAKAGYGCDTSVFGIAKAMTDAANDPEGRQHFSDGAVQLVRNDFDRDVIASSTVLMYGNILKTVINRSKCEGK